MIAPDKRTFIINELNKMKGRVREKINNIGPMPMNPTISPLIVTDYGSSSIDLSFLTTSTAIENVKGVLWGTTNPPTFDNADYKLLYGTGDVNLSIAGLQNNTEYYLRPYALSNLGYKYGDVVAQRTKYGPIPDEYQLVEYLESSDGSQWIDTGVVLTADSRVEISSYNGCWFGARTMMNVNSFCCIFAESYTTIRFDYGNTQNISIRKTADNYHIVYNGNHITLTKNNESPITYVAPYYQYFSSGTTCYLFVIHTGMSVTTNVAYAGMRVSNFKINDIMNLYPVYRISDNKPGMYDIVNNVFYTNQGTGEFIVGPDKEWEE